MKKNDIKLLKEKSQNGDFDASYELATYYDNLALLNNMDKNKQENLLNKALSFCIKSLQQGNKKANFNLSILYSELGDTSSSLKHLYDYLNDFSNNDDIALFAPLTRLEKGITFKGTFSYDEMKLYLSCANIILKRNEEGKISNFFSFFLKSLTKKNVETIYHDFIESFNNYKFESSFGKYYLLLSDYKNALKHLEIGQLNNSALCCEYLGDYYCGYYDKFVTNYELAIYYYQKEIKLKRNIGKIYLANALIKKDRYLYENEIVELYKKSFKIDSNSYTYIGDYYMLLQKYQLATHYYYTGHLKGNKNSSINYARNLRDGIGCNQDIEEAINIFENIIKVIDDESPSQRNEYNNIYAFLSEIYIDNKYARKNGLKAFNYSNIGNSLDNIECTYILGNCYLNGYGTKINKIKGNRLINEAIQLGFNIDNFKSNRQSNVNIIYSENVNEYLTQIEDKNSIIQKQQLEIKSCLNEILYISKNTNNKVENISNKIDSINNAIINIKQTYGNVLDKISNDNAEYENIMSLISNRIIDMVEIKTCDNAIEENLHNLFGEENWNKLSNESKNYLITAKILFSELSKRKYKNNVDFSAVCLMICKAIENELKQKFFFNFIKFLDKKFNKDYTYYHAQLTIKTVNGEFKLRDSNKITLGDYPYILCASFTKGKFSDYYDESKADTIEYCNTVVFNKKIDSSYLDKLAYDIEKIKNDYRNPACHSSTVSYITAKECVDFILDYTKFFINFISDCKK